MSQPRAETVDPVDDDETLRTRVDSRVRCQSKYLRRATRSVQELTLVIRHVPVEVVTLDHHAVQVLSLIHI